MQTLKVACPSCGGTVQINHEPSDVVSIETLVNMALCNGCYDQRSRVPGTPAKIPVAKQFKRFELTRDEEEFFNRRYPQ